MTVKYDGSTTKPVNAKTYVVTVDVTAGSTYGPVTNLYIGEFTVNKATMTSSNITIADMTWTGKQIKPTSFIFNGKSYPIAGNATVGKVGVNKNIGLGTIELTGVGANFEGNAVISFKILPKVNKVSKITRGKAKMTVKWTKVSKAQKVSGYDVWYRQVGTTAWIKKTYKASKSSVTFKKLLKGQKYEVQVRSFKTISGTRFESAWSPVKISGLIM